MWFLTAILAEALSVFVQQTSAPASGDKDTWRDCVTMMQPVFKHHMNGARLQYCQLHVSSCSSAAQLGVARALLSLCQHCGMAMNAGRSLCLCNTHKILRISNWAVSIPAQHVSNASHRNCLPVSDSALALVCVYQCQSGILIICLYMQVCCLLWQMA